MTQSKHNRIIITVVAAVVLTALFTLTATAEITGGFGEILGLDFENKSYQLKSAIISEDGKGVLFGAIDEEFTASENTGLAGLYSVKEENGDWSELIYVYGDISKRSALGNWTKGTNKIIPNSAKGDSFIAGTWVAPFPDWRYQNSTVILGGFESETSYVLTIYPTASLDNALDLYALTHTWETAESSLSSTTKDRIKNKYDTYYEKNEADSTYGEIKEEYKNKADQIKEVIKTDYEGLVFKYAYEPEEIIPVSELSSFPYSVTSFDWFIYPTVAKAQAVFYVMDKYGKVTTHTWTSDNLKTLQKKNILNTTFDPQSIEGFPTEGWIVAVDIKPFGVAEASTVIATPNAAKNIDTTSSAFYSFYWDDYKVNYPAPTGLSLEGTKLIGLTDGVTYSVSALDVNGDVGEAKTVTSENNDLAAIFGASPVGLYSVYVAADENYGASDSVILYAKGAYNDRKDILEHDDTPQIKRQGNTSSFVSGYLTHTASHSADGANATIAVGHFIWKGTLDKFYEADDSGKKTAFEAIAEKAKTYEYRYTLTPSEITPVNEVVSYTFGLKVRSNTTTIKTFNYKNNTVRFDAHVIRENGTLETYTTLFEGVTFNKGTENTFTVDFGDSNSWESELPDDGYFVAYTIYPYYGFTDYKNLTVAPNGDASANYINLNFIHHDAADGYVLVEDVVEPKVEKYETNNKFTNRFDVTNYTGQLEYEYAYSDSNETTPESGWVRLTQKSLYATEPDKYVWIKRLATGDLKESVVCAEKPSESAVVTGINLELNGKLGLIINYRYNPDTVEGVKLNITAYDNQSNHSYNQSDIKYENVSAGEGRAILYVLPRDAGMVYFDNEFSYTTTDKQSVNISSVPVKLSVASVVDTYKALAAHEGEDEYDEVLPLITALETYYTYTANYFDTETDALGTLTLTTEEQTLVDGTTPDKEGSLPGLQFHSSSLILESSTTLRHYFKVTDADAYIKAVYTIGEETVTFTNATVEEGSTNSYVYFDIKNISADKLNTKQTVTITSGENSFTVRFSVIDYVKLAQNDTDSKLANLAKAVAKYANASKEYNK